jgi:hypothetical protein
MHSLSESSVEVSQVLDSYGSHIIECESRVGCRANIKDRFRAITVSPFGVIGRQQLVFN